jgi:hypothetical protein
MQTTTETGLQNRRLRNGLSIGPTWRFLSGLALALSSAGACESGDDTELSEQAAVTKEDLSPRTISRVVNVANGVQRQFTGTWQPQLRCTTSKTASGPRTTCLAITPGDYTEAAVHENAGAGPGDAPFGARWGNQPYQGCGIAAAYNVLAYFGAADPFPVGIRFTNFGDGKIMSAPSTLRGDLETALNRQANGSYTVEMFNGSPTFRIVGDALAHGGVVVALVNNGTHWQVLTGLRRAGLDDFARVIFEYYAIDYGSGGTWRTEAALDLELHGWDSLGSTFGLGDGLDYRSDTFLIVRKNS